MARAAPLTLGTAGHIDHGKTALVTALTGHDTDRLPEERARGISIALGYAPLALPSGRTLSLVDVPGHERFVRTMVAGATGVDCFLLVVAADDGVMPQTVEHAEVLAALGVTRGVVAITKADLADPGRAAAEAAELVPGCEVVACSARTGEGVAEVAAALDRLAASLPSRGAPADGAGAEGPVLHVDRSFSIAGRGTVVTGTLWRGELAGGDALTLLPGDVAVRVRGLQVHDADIDRADAGQRVAVALAGVRARDVHRGDVLTTPASGVGETQVLDCVLALRDAHHNERVQVHHGTRDVAGRLAHLEDDLWQVRLERPVAARDGDRLVVRRQSPPDTLGGGTVLVARARRHGRRDDQLGPLRRRRDGIPEPAPDPVVPEATTPPAPARAAPTPLSASARALADELREAGRALRSEAQLADAPPDALRELRDAGVAVRVSGRLYGHAEVVAEVRVGVEALLADGAAASLADVRDALGLSRKTAQAFLEHLDAERVTRRREDDSRVLRARRA